MLPPSGIAAPPTPAPVHAAEPLPDHPRAVLISNPASRSGHRSKVLRSALAVLAEAGWTVSWRKTEAAGHAVRLARDAARDGCDVVLAAGGDGTVNEVANGLVDTRAALGILPLGTGNVFAAQLGLVGIPTPLHKPDPVAAAGALATGALRWADVGFAQPRGGPGRHFLMAAGIGFDAAVTQDIESVGGKKIKRVLGPAAFGAVGLRRVLGTRPEEALVNADGVRVRGSLILAVASNIKLYGGAVELTPAAVLDDEVLDVTLFFGDNPRAAAAHVGAVMAGRSAGRETLQAARVRIVARSALPVQLDGDPFCSTPVTLVARARALRLVVPAGAPRGIFSDGMRGA